MDSPPFLFDQYARQRGISPTMAKRALMLQGYSVEGRALKDAAKTLKISAKTAKMLARKFIIDFPDYRPYARLEAKGEARPAPFLRADKSATDLPLFAA